MNTKTDTLHGGRNLTVDLLGGGSRAVTVHQIQISRYNEAFRLMADELKLVAFATGLTGSELDNIQPEHYELLRAAVWEVNAKGFFAYADRTLTANKNALRELPPEILKSFLDKLATN